MVFVAAASGLVLGNPNLGDAKFHNCNVILIGLGDGRREPRGPCVGCSWMSGCVSVQPWVG